MVEASGSLPIPGSLDEPLGRDAHHRQLLKEKLMNPSGEFWLGEGKGKGEKADSIICPPQQGKEDEVQKWR